MITGDLTEDGVDSQFELLAELLHDSAIAPERITLLPGNHDVYDHGQAWDHAIAGPLRAFASTSGPGAQTQLDGVTIVPVSTAYFQSYLFARGAIRQPDLARLSTAAERSDGDALVVALHHSPQQHDASLLRWFDGLHGKEQVRGLLAQHPHAYALHGHTHEATERAVVSGRSPQIFSCKAVVADAASVRFYRSFAGTLRPDERLEAVPMTSTSGALLPAVS